MGLSKSNAGGLLQGLDTRLWIDLQILKIEKRADAITD
jgi:hypothetical protein